MKRLLIAAVALIAAAATTDAGAAVVHYRSGYHQSATTSTYATPSYTYRSGYYGYRAPQRVGPFARMMEFERRKNAMLRRMFGGY